MEVSLMGALEKVGWHLQPSAIPNLLHQIQEEEEGVRLGGKDLEKRVRAELLDTDLSVVGVRFLPDTQSLLQMRSLPTPSVLQVESINDISESSQRSGSTGRMLRLRLTDGHLFLTAIEYRPIPSLSLDIPTGTKVVLQGTVTVHGGIVLLDSNSIRVEGGHVAALHETWLMQKKYAGALARPTSDGSGGPPPFRALPMGTKGALAPKTIGHSGAVANTTPVLPSTGANKSSQDVRELVGSNVQSTEDMGGKLPAPRMRPGAEPYIPRVGQANTGRGETEVPGAQQPFQSELQTRPNNDIRSGISAASTAPPPSAAVAVKSGHAEAPEGRVRDKVGPEAVPVQNRQAAQKLLDRRSDVGMGNERGRGRGRGFRRGGRHDSDDQDEQVMTLDEWEARKVITTSGPSVAVSDQELARRLQQQFNMEDSHGGQAKVLDAAEQLRLSMFSFAPEQTNSEEGGRGRGRSRGRGRGRGRR